MSKITSNKAISKITIQTTSGNLKFDVKKTAGSSFFAIIREDGSVFSRGFAYKHEAYDYLSDYFSCK